MHYIYLFPVSLIFRCRIVTLYLKPHILKQLVLRKWHKIPPDYGESITETCRRNTINICTE